MAMTMFTKLRRIRKQQHVTAREMANLLELKTENAYYKKEMGMVAFTLMEAKAVADRLGLTIDEIFFGE